VDIAHASSPEFMVLQIKHWNMPTVIMLIKCMIQFSARNSILRIYGQI